MPEKFKIGDRVTMGLEARRMNTQCRPESYNGTVTGNSFRRPGNIYVKRDGHGRSYMWHKSAWERKAGSE